MSNKKSQAGIIIFIAVLIILIIAIALFVYFGSKKGIFNKGKEVIKEPSLTINARILDPSGQLARMDYSIEDNDNGIEIRKGVLEPSWNQFRGMPVNKTYRFCFWSDKYYRQCEIYERSNSYRILSKVGRNITLANMTMDGQIEIDTLKGKIEIKPLGRIEKGTEQILRFNISVRNGSLKRLALCTWHSVGIIYLFNPKTEIRCSAWVNYTFDIEGKRINLSDNFFWCNENQQLEKCNKVIHQSRCEVPNMIPPKRSKVDSCFYTGVNVQNSDYIAEYEIKTMDFINELDYIQLYIIDRELTKRESSYGFYDTDDEGKDNGIIDIMYQLNYSR